MKAPMAYFGGKSQAASEIWRRFGAVKCYVEPFCGSAAVLLARPPLFSGIEIINDLDYFVANFWRAAKAEPEALRDMVDWPVNEADLHARHLWLVTAGRKLAEQCYSDPDFYDLKCAAWWCWGLACWIGSGWCAAGSAEEVPGSNLPHITKNLAGVHSKAQQVLNQLPNLATRKGTQTLDYESESYYTALAKRLRYVRVCCGDWTRVLSHSATTYNGVTGIFFDPPYGSARTTVYTHDSGNVAAAVRAWCVEHDNDAQIRVALSGYAGEHEELESRGWTVHEWKARGGYGSMSDGQARDNAAKERIWFSPNCLVAKD